MNKCKQNYLELTSTPREGPNENNEYCFTFTSSAYLLAKSIEREKSS